MSFPAVAAAFVRREFLEDVSYPLRVVSALAAAVVGLAFLTFFSDFVGAAISARFGLPEGGFMAFALIGVSYHALLDTALRDLSGRIRQAQHQGTLEALLATRTPLRHVMLALPVYPMLRTCVRIAFFLSVGALFLGVPLQVRGLLMAAAAFGAGIVVFGAIGLAFAGLTIVFQRTEPLIHAFNGACFFLGGVLLPWQELPPALKVVASFLPLTPALDAFRYAMLDGSDWSVVRPALLRLTLFAAVLVPLGIIVLRWSVRRALRDGSLSRY